MRKSVLLIEPGEHLGGMFSGGLSATDIGNKYAVTVLARDFYRRVGSHYGMLERWTFEPHVTENIFNDYIKWGKVPVLYGHKIVSALKREGVIQEIVLEEAGSSKGATKVIRAKMFIDCSYEGDLMTRAGVSYTVGREGNSQYNETYNGVQLRHEHQFPDGVNPYREKENPQSGLLWGISDRQMATPGTGDSKVHAYNYRICLTEDPANLLPITRPEGYDCTRYELLRLMEAQPEKRSLYHYFSWIRMPNGKTDINNHGGFSTDMIGMNYRYREATYAEREQIISAHEVNTKGLLYFTGHDPRVPVPIREEMLKWGYPKDEYKDNGHWSPQLYIREARRMKGEYIMTQANCQGKEIVKDDVGMAAYTMDSHNVQRLVVNGMVKNEGDVQVGDLGPYPIAYRSIIPKKSECSNLLVPVCLSATHITYGSIRMEPVFMVLAVAAGMAIDSNLPVQEVDVPKLQQILKTNPLADGSQP